jgi:hypothetical protein
MEYKGTWNAATNTPTLVNGTGNQGDVYLCNVAGTVDFGAGPIVFFVGDQVIYSGTIWQRASGASGTVTSVAVTESGDALTITGSPITTSGTINIGFAGTSGQYINGAGGLTSFPSLTGFVPYTGATANLDLGTFNLTADVITGATGSFASSGGSNTFDINHSSGSGIALNITKGGNGEGLYINKTSGSGNAATITGGVTLLSELHLTTDLADAYIASAATWNAKQNAITLTTTGTSGAATLVGATLNIPQYQGVLTNPVTGTGLNGAIPKFTTTGSTIGSSIIFDSGTQIGINTLSPSFTLDVNGTARVNGVLTLSSTISNGTYTYTLPSATGTLALTSQIPSLSGYVQGTGNANYVALFNGTSSIGNSIIYQSGTNVGIMNASPTTTLDVTGGGQFSGSIIALSFIKSGGTSAQILAADGSVITAGTNITISGGTISTTGSGITGSGTTNYLPKFTGASSIGNSLIFDNGTNIGIGLTSPSYKLDVQDNGVSGIVDVASFSVTGNGGSGRGVGILLGAAGSSNSVQVARLVGYHDLAISSAVAASFAIQVANSSGTLTERLRVTQAGNLIIGTTTDAGARLLISGGYTGFQYNSAGAYPAYNTYFGAIGTNFSNANSELDIWNTVGGGFVFRKQTGASAQTALMTITNGGNVGIGTSSPSTITSGARVLQVDGSSYGFILASSGSVVGQMIGDAGGNVAFGSRSNHPMTLTTNDTERIRITTGGNVGIGTSSPSQRLTIAQTNGYPVIDFNNSGTTYGDLGFQVDKMVLSSYSTTPLTFWTNGSERMRIESSGGIIISNIGITTGGLNLISPNSYNSVAYNSACLATASISFYHFVGQSGNGSTITTNNILIYGNGNVQNANNSYGAISDIKLKENIVDATPKLDNLMKVRIVNYSLKTDLGYESNKQIGIIAQELEQVFPGLVEDIEDFKEVEVNDEEGNITKEKQSLGTVTKSVKYSVFIPMLIKAMQEQTQIIKDLESRIVSLESK